MARRKDAGSPPSIKAAQGLAAEVARKYGNFECEACAREIAKTLGREAGAVFERLRTSDQSDVIGLVEHGVQISANRVHVGVRVGDRVFDNWHHEGVPAGEWPGRFVTATEAPLVQESRPVGEFFGRQFLVKRFRNWLFGP